MIGQEGFDCLRHRCFPRRDSSPRRRRRSTCASGTSIRARWAPRLFRARCAFTLVVEVERASVTAASPFRFGAVSVVVFRV